MDKDKKSADIPSLRLKQFANYIKTYLMHSPDTFDKILFTWRFLHSTTWATELFFDTHRLFTHNVDCKLVHSQNKRTLFFLKFINSIYCFFCFCSCSAVCWTSSQSKNNCTATKQMKRKLKSFSSFAFCVDNQCSWILKRRKKEPRHDRHFLIKHFTSMWHFACHLISVSFNWKREFNNFI